MRKRCPGSFFKKNLWEKFLQDVQKPMKVELDLSKSSVGVPVQQKALDERIKFVMDEILKVDRVKVNYNGKEIELRGKNIQGTNYVSIRDLAEALNLKVGWNQDKKIVELRG
ncbi:copper amine oxidase N-terminal domain-containing protein [Peptoniphilus sp. GNH]|nr:copper amine oxidase N-terminal domain-containing protein [Peptoniphilus sp. GNH]